MINAKKIVQILEQEKDHAPMDKKILVELYASPQFVIQLLDEMNNQGFTLSNEVYMEFLEPKNEEEISKLRNEFLKSPKKSFDHNDFSIKPENNKFLLHLEVFLNQGHSYDETEISEITLPYERNSLKIPDSSLREDLKDYLHALLIKGEPLNNYYQSLFQDWKEKEKNYPY